MAVSLLCACEMPPAAMSPEPRQPNLFTEETETEVSAVAPSAAPVAPASLRALNVAGFGSALLFSPTGSDSRPLLIAAHGAGGSPEWECEYWRMLTGDRVFVLCLRGTPLGSYPGYYYSDHRALERELVAAEASARSAEPRIAASSGLYAGFSQGSTMGSVIVGRHASTFPFVVLIEGFQLWNVPMARDFARRGGKRVLIACGSKECAKVGASSVNWLKKAGLDARLEFAPGEGHTPLGGVQTRIEDALPWLLGDDPAWQALTD